MLPTIKVVGFPPQWGFRPRFVCGRRLGGTTAVQPEGRVSSLRRTPIPPGIRSDEGTVTTRGHYLLVLEEMGCHSRFNSRWSHALPQRRGRGLNLVRGRRSRVSTDRRDGGRSGRSVRGRITAARITEGICDGDTGCIEALCGVERFVRCETAAGRHAETSGCGRLRAPHTTEVVGFRVGRHTV